MTRKTWIWDAGRGELVEAHTLYRSNNKRSGLASPMVVTDTMAPVQSMLDGKMYDSKAALRATYKASGMVEVGNDSSIVDPKPFKRQGPDRKAIRAATDRAFSKAGLGS